MPKHKAKDFFCSVVSEKVKISLKTKATLGQAFKNKLHVQCDQFECQYADENIPPCPLTLDLFAKEIEEREEETKSQKKRGRRLLLKSNHPQYAGFSIFYTFP